MNLEEQLGALENGVDTLIEAAAQPPSPPVADATAAPPAASAPAPESPPAAPVLRIERPEHNAITLTIGAQTVALDPSQVGQLIEELSNARASMQPEPPVTLPEGWRYAATRNPVFASKKQSNGDRLVVLRHLGHGWVPYVLSPDAVLELYMVLTQR